MLDDESNRMYYLFINASSQRINVYDDRTCRGQMLFSSSVNIEESCTAATDDDLIITSLANSIFGEASDLNVENNHSLWSEDESSCEVTWDNVITSLQTVVFSSTVSSGKLKSNLLD